VRMYKPGYTPSSLAIFEGLQLYRNSATGIFVHRSSNILITNSNFADNNIGIDLDRTDGIEVRNTVVIGESASYRSLMARQSVDRVCRNEQDRWLVGIDLHTWKKEKELAGAMLSNITLSGFKNVQCPNSASIRYDSQVSYLVLHEVLIGDERSTTKLTFQNSRIICRLSSKAFSNFTRHLQKQETQMDQTASTFVKHWQTASK
jgi:parallel beta-helix repeat protein